MSLLNAAGVIDQIRAAARDDAQRRPMARLSSDVPWAAEAVTLDWLNAVLAASAGAGAPFESFELTSGSEGTSVRHSVKLRRPGGEELNLFAKTCPAFEHRFANVLTRTAQAEGRFYAEIRPQLNIEAPLGYFWAADDTDTYRSIILIEDLVHAKNATFCGKDTAISFDEARDLVTLLATFHGHFMGKGELATSFPWLRTFGQWAEDMKGLRPQHLEAMETARDVIPAGIAGRGGDIFDMFLRVLEDDETQPRTLIHSDVHLGNWYKTGEGRMGLCDWQCCNRGPWARDFAYAVSTTLAVEDRRQWERVLLEVYLRRLEEVSGAAPAFDAAFLAYRRRLPAALLMWTPTLCPAPNFPAMQPVEMSRLMIERMAAAIEDLDALAAVPG